MGGDAATVDRERYQTRENNSPLIPPFNPFTRTSTAGRLYSGVCNGAYDASRQNNDLDFNTFAFITPGHLSPPLRRGSRPARLFFRHSTFRRVTLVIIRMLCSCADGARFVEMPSKCDTDGRTDGLPPGTRSARRVGATAAGKEGSERARKAGRGDIADCDVATTLG